MHFLVLRSVAIVNNLLTDFDYNVLDPWPSIQVRYSTGQDNVRGESLGNVKLLRSNLLIT